MSDRAERAELEATQTELRAARARLAAPLDGLRAEVSDALDRLAQEGHALQPTVDALRATADEARLRLITARTERPATLSRKLGTSSLTVLACGAAVGGAILGLWLERQGFPPWLSWLTCGGAALLVFTDLSAVVRWAKK